MFRDDKSRVSADFCSSMNFSFVLEKEVITNEEINREIVNLNPMCTGHEKIPEYLNNRILVGWDGFDDPENPKNWPYWKKIIATVILCAITATQYAGSAIITTSQPRLQEYFGANSAETHAGIALFVWGYALGDLWFTPMSEIPLFRGRNPTYFGCQFMFAILQIPLGLLTHINLAGYLVLRFLSGIFASPPLSTTAASINDMWDMPEQSIALVGWVLGQTMGPYMGPLIGAALTLTHSVSYVFWALLAMSGGMLVIMLVLLPETSEQELLMRKAIMLRKEMESDSYISPAEILMHTQTPGAVLEEMFFKPIKMTIIDPVLLLINIHVALVYSSMYMYLEAMPIVYQDTYGFNTVQLGLAFLPCIGGNVIGGLFYIAYIWRTQHKLDDRPEKVFGPCAMVGAIAFCVGMILWGWLSREGIHWGGGIIGNVIFGIGDIVTFESYFAFIGMLYPPSSAGSAYASNNLMRGTGSGALVMVAQYFYHNTAVGPAKNYPVGPGCTILAAIGVLLLPLPIFLTIKGKDLRELAARKYAKD